MEQALSLKYMRSVQQLQKKKQELDEVFSAARGFEEENSFLKKENAELKRLVQQHEETARTRNEEIHFLEAQVRKLQQKLQTYIDDEIQQDNHKTQQLTSTSPQEVEREIKETTRKHQQEIEAMNVKETQLTEKLSLLETQVSNLKEEKDTAAQTSEKYRNGADMLYKEVITLRSENEKIQGSLGKANLEVDKLKKREEDLSSTVKHYEKESVRVATETKELDEFETKALEGLKMELLVLSGENNKVLEQLGLERESHSAIVAEYSAYESKLEKQRELHQEQMKIMTEESNALTAHCEGILQDLKGIAQERDELRKELEQKTLSHKLLRDLAKPAETLKQRAALVQRGSPRSPLQSPSAASPTHAKKFLTTVESSTMTEQVEEHSSEKRVVLELEEEATVLKRDLEATIDECDTLKKLLKEKDATEGLRKQKEMFLHDEVQLLREELQRQRQTQTPLQKLVEGGLSSTSSSFLDGGNTSLTTADNGRHGSKTAGAVVDATGRVVRLQREYLEQVIHRMAEILFKATKTMKIQEVAVDVLTTQRRSDRSKSTDSTASDSSAMFATDEDDNQGTSTAQFIWEEMIQRHRQLARTLRELSASVRYTSADDLTAIEDAVPVLAMRKLDEHLKSLRQVVSWLHRGTKRIVKPFRKKTANNPPLPVHPRASSSSSRQEQQHHHHHQQQQRSPQREENVPPPQFVVPSNEVVSYYEEVLGLSPNNNLVEQDEKMTSDHHSPQWSDGGHASGSMQHDSLKDLLGI